MDEKPVGQRLTSAQRVAEPAAYLAVNVRIHRCSVVMNRHFIGPGPHAHATLARTKLGAKDGR